MRFSVVVLIVCSVCIWSYASADFDQLTENEDGLPFEENAEDRSGASAHVGAAVITRQRTVIRPLQLAPNVHKSYTECFACTDCPQALPNTTTKICPYALDVSKQRQCVVYVEQYKHMKKPWYVRGCASERGSCADIRQAHDLHSEIVKLVSCNECEGDRCNTSGSMRSQSSIIMAFVAFIVIPLISKYTLS